MRTPCHLHFLLARDAPTGVLFRRGPTRWVQLIRWNVADDSFEEGQWFKGRIYEHRSDLSPDGRRLLYFAQKINAHTLADPEHTYAWSAISRPPYFTALALWPKGDCWNGGGMFETDRRIWLNHFADQAQPHARHQPQGLEVTYTSGPRGEDATVLERRLARDGWTLVQPWKGHYVASGFERAYQEMIAQGLSSEEMLAESLRSKLYEQDGHSRYVTEQPEVREKSGPAGCYVLVMTMDVRGFARTYRFSVRCDVHGSFQSLGSAEWADWDQKGRLAFVHHGQLLVAKPASCGSWAPHVIARFGAGKPEALSPPDWARQWE